jgi:hypothetical protein
MKQYSSSQIKWISPLSQEIEFFNDLFRKAFFEIEIEKRINYEEFDTKNYDFTEYYNEANKPRSSMTESLGDTLPIEEEKEQTPFIPQSNRKKSKMPNPEEAKLREIEYSIKAEIGRFHLFYNGFALKRFLYFLKMKQFFLNSRDIELELINSIKNIKQQTKLKLKYLLQKHFNINLSLTNHGIDIIIPDSINTNNSQLIILRTEQVSLKTVQNSELEETLSPFNGTHLGELLKHTEEVTKDHSLLQIQQPTVFRFSHLISIYYIYLFIARIL